jgi:hypothetical protein
MVMVVLVGVDIGFGARLSLFFAAILVVLSVRGGPIAILLVASCFIFGEILNRRYERAVNARGERESVIQALETIHNETYVLGGSTPASIKRIAGIAGLEARVRDFFVEVGSRISLGEQLGQALSKAKGGSAFRQAGDIAGALDEDSGDSIRCALDEEDRKSAERHELEAYSVQKYLTLNMVCSTVIPSLALFGFVGYSIMGSSAVAALAFTTAFTAAIPLAYRAVRIRLAHFYV